MERYIDLHTHTAASDGTDSPSALVERAAALGLAAVAVTDHDTQSGVAEALAAGARWGVEVLPGVELNCGYRDYGIHILGYFPQAENPRTAALCRWAVEQRDARNARIAAAMRADGVDISLEDLARRFPGSVLGRPHFAAVLVEQGRAESVSDAFRRWLSRGCPYYRKRVYISLEQGFEAIRADGGKAVFAHPFQYGMPEPELLALTDTLRYYGLAGIECLYSAYSPAQTGYLTALAKRYGLLVTGGSDYHGLRKPHIALGRGTGDLAVPYALLEALREGWT